MEFLLDRKWKKETYTIGRLYINNVYFSDTIEDKDRGLTASMSSAEITLKKVYGETAIPSGVYELKMTYSPKFATKVWGRKYKGKVPELLYVKGFSGVRIHPGNTATDTLGCILVGRNTEKGKVTQSTNYYYKLLDNYILPATQRGEKITLTIQ